MALVLRLTVNCLTSARTEPSVHHPPLSRAKCALRGPQGWENRDLCHQAGWDIQQPPLAHHLEEALETWIGQKMLSKTQEGAGVCNADKRR